MWTPYCNLNIRRLLNPKMEGPCPCGAICILKDIANRMQTLRDLPWVQYPPTLLVILQLTLHYSFAICAFAVAGVYVLWVRWKALFVLNLSIIAVPDLTAGTISLQVHLIIFYNHERSCHYFLLPVEKREDVNTFCFSIHFCRQLDCPLQEEGSG